MEREIKFQVLIKNKIVGVERLNGTQWQWMYSELNSDKGERWTNGVYGNAPDIIRRQFTGLKDKNGKEVYEGDIMNYSFDYDDEKLKKKAKTYKGYIIYNKAHCSFELAKKGDSNGLVFNAGHFCVFEVIGNIYEIPKTLEAKIK